MNWRRKYRLPILHLKLVENIFNNLLFMFSSLQLQLKLNDPFNLILRQKHYLLYKIISGTFFYYLLFSDVQNATDDLFLGKRVKKKFSILSHSLNKLEILKRIRFIDQSGQRDNENVVLIFPNRIFFTLL